MFLIVILSTNHTQRNISSIECNYLTVMLSVIMFNVTMLGVVMVNLIILCVVMPNVTMQSVVMLSAVMLNVILTARFDCRPLRPPLEIVLIYYHLLTAGLAAISIQLALLAPGQL
jgi:hypothetical protein